jgi:hypothetical protein
VGTGFRKKIMLKQEAAPAMANPCCTIGHSRNRTSSKRECMSAFPKRTCTPCAQEWDSRRKIAVAEIGLAA